MSDLVALCEDNMQKCEINMAVSNINDMFSHMLSGATAKGKKGKGRKNQPWWSRVCSALKKEKNHWLYKYRRNKCQDNLNTYLDAKQKFRHECKEARETFEKSQYEKLESAMASCSDCWQVLKNMKKCDVGNCISPTEWKEYFQNLLNNEREVGDGFRDEVVRSLHEHDQNCEQCEQNTPQSVNEDITVDEVIDSVDSLKPNKAPGPDGLTAEMLKVTRSVLVPLLWKLFNKILECRQFPEEWAKALIVPIHKKGPVSDPGNYRGISLTSVIGKVFMKIIQKRITAWAESESLFDECQAGFRKGRSTIDQIFVLQSVIQKYLSKPRGRFYCIFVDFSKAFDSVPHAHLWYKLIHDYKLHGKVIQVLRSLYSQLASVVNTKQGLSESFRMTVGTRQGCLVSPLLFILYLNSATEMFSELGESGIYINETYRNVCALLYADDMAQISDMVGHLQNQLVQLEKFCSQWSMDVNIDKTKIIVFRNGGTVRRNEQWRFKGMNIDIVPFYKYLGVMFTSKLCWTKAQDTLAAQASKTVHFIQQACHHFKRMPYNIYWHLFDKMVLPILTYGAEVWGYSTHACIENVQNNFCKFVLNVPINAPNVAARGECGRVTVKVHCILKLIKYWCKLLQMEDSRLPRACYSMLYNLDRNGRKTWASHVKHILFKLGFGIVWISQEVGNITLFINEVNQRLVDQAKQDWHAELDKYSKLTLMKETKSLLEPEKYLNYLELSKYRSAMARFRCSSHNLNIEVGRRLGIEPEQRHCRLCLNIGEVLVEDEYHFIFQCTAMTELRTLYLPQKYIQNPTSENYVALFQSNKKDVVQGLAKYIYYGLKYRNNML